MKKLFVYPYSVWLAIFIVIPLVLVLYYSLTGTDGNGTVYFTTANYARFFQGSYPGEPFLKRVYISVTLKSIKIALLSTAFCFLLGYPAAYIIAGKKYSDKSFLLFLFLVPMWMSFLLRTYAWLTILEQNGVLNAVLLFLRLPKTDILYTDAAVILGMVYNFLPFMVLPIYTSLTRMDPLLIEAAQDLGADGKAIFFRVVFPLSIPGVVSGFTMVFMPGVTAFIISNLLGGGQYILIGNLIEQQFLKVGDWHFGSAISMILILVILITMGFFSRADNENKTERQLLT